MTTFSDNISFGLILEIGNDDVLMQVGNEQMVVPLTDEAKELVYRNAEEQIYIAPIDLKNKRIVLEAKSAAVQEYN